MMSLLEPVLRACGQVTDSREAWCETGSVARTKFESAGDAGA